MLINVTLLLQMFHFAVAYFLLKRLLLRPAVIRIMKDEKNEQALQSALAAQQKRISEEEDTQQRQGLQLKELLREQVPTHDELVSFQAPEIEISQVIVSEKQINTMAQEVKDALVKQLSHD